MKMRFLLALAALAGRVTTAFGAGTSPGHSVVVVVFDGMRPEFVSQTLTPNLWRLAQDGVFFANHHPVFCSSTQVNGTAIATGAYPSHSFVIANSEFRPAINPQRDISMSQPASIRRGDKISGGHYLGVSTLAEYLRTQGVATAIAGSKDIALLQDRNGTAPVIYDGKALTKPLTDEVISALGDFPALGVDPATHRTNMLLRDDWSARALTEVLWRDGLPPYSMLWLSEPDESEHSFGPGSLPALTAIKNSDVNLGRVLAALKRRGLLATTDVLVVADHGMSTVERSVDVATALSKAGFNASRAVLGGIKPGQVMVVGNNGSDLLYIGGHDATVARRLAAWLPTQDWAGAIFSREAIDGTFSLAEAHIDSPDAPDLAVALQWNDSRNTDGARGMITVDGSTRGKGQGAHGSLNPSDMHNTFIAAGPDFKQGIRDPLPSGNFDLVPTILHVLGFQKEAARRDGRVLSEALTIAAPPLEKIEFKRITARRDTPVGVWTQYLLVSEVNGVRYLDEGNGALLPQEQAGRSGASGP